MASGRFTGQEHLGPLVAESLGIKVPAVKCEAACASGALAFRQAWLAIQSGKYDVVLVTGVEKMSDVKVEEASLSLMAAGEQEWEGSAGLTFAGAYALMARAHMHKYGTTQEQLAAVAVNNHKNGVRNPFAQFRFPVTLETVLNAPIIADPLRLFDCSPITDGAASLVLVSEKAAKKFESPIWIKASEQASDALALHNRASLYEIAAAENAAKKAYQGVGITPDDIDVAEVHDCFTINEIMCIEALGFCEKGRGGRFVEHAKMAVDGEKPINITGGLKAIGHPVGATGVRQLADLTKILRGDDKEFQGAEIGLALNIGGSGATAIVSILGLEK
jgi:acetyl-CoA C-acetyltransferase